MKHLRPHPTEVSEKRNIEKKFEMKRRTTKYLFAFDPTNYCDMEIFNITGEKTTVYEGLRTALRYSEIPIVFFLCYDVGYKEALGVFVRHVVCCMARQSNVYFFDMRNLSEIDKGLQKRIEKELYDVSGKHYTLVNLACNRSRQCRYLQRYKGETEMGWCIGWALLFLDFLTQETSIPERSDSELLEMFHEAYEYIDGELSRKKSNYFIESYYVRLLEE